MRSEDYGSHLCVCVRLSTAILAIQAMGRLMSDTTDFKTTRSSGVHSYLTYSSHTCAHLVYTRDNPLRAAPTQKA